jgi:hypothetical protein
VSGVTRSGRRACRRLSHSTTQGFPRSTAPPLGSLPRLRRGRWIHERCTLGVPQRPSFDRTVVPKEQQGVEEIRSLDYVEYGALPREIYSPDGPTIGPEPRLPARYGGVRRFGTTH